MQKNLLEYPVEFVDDVFGESTTLADTIRRVSGVETPRVLIIADYNIFECISDIREKIVAYFETHTMKIVGTPCVIGSGEKIKLDQPHCMMKLMELFTKQNMRSDDVVLAFGGGAVLDLAGFVTAVHSSNAKFIRIPSTPAAMFGAGYATHAMLDIRLSKDALKVVSKPSAVIIDTSLAKTVLDGVWRAGMAEAMRIALVSDVPLTKGLAMLASAYNSRNQTALTRLVKAMYAVRMRAEDSDFAIWVTNRLEEMSRFRLPHGYAVAMALTIETRYAVLRGFMTEAERELVINALKTSGALDGAEHSRFLLSRGKDILKAVPDKIVVVNKLGASVVEVPDQALYLQAVNLIK